MKTTMTPIPDVLVIEPTVFEDTRGFFFERFNQGAFNDAVSSHITFVQDNHSRSSHGVLRGLHFQKRQPQGKLVSVVRGAVFDVAVDIRQNSRTFGHWAGIELTEDNKKQLWIPPGLAHGFLVLSETADVFYKTTDYYAPGHEGRIIWNDADIGISWPISGAPQLSMRDAAAGSLRDAEFAGSLHL